MTIREKLADWISGGALTKAYMLANEEFNASHQALRRLHQSNSALRQITALETPKANATVRKMARIARDALGE